MVDAEKKGASRFNNARSFHSAAHFFPGSNELISVNIPSTKKQQDKCAGIFSRLNDSLALVFALPAKFICPCDSAKNYKSRWMGNER